MSVARTASSGKDFVYAVLKAHVTARAAAADSSLAREKRGERLEDLERAASIEKALATLSNVVARVEKNDLPGPMIPTLLAEVRDLFSDKNVRFGSIAALVRRHPALALRVLGLANSAFYRGKGERYSSTGIEAAIARLGMLPTAALMHAVAALSYWIVDNKRREGSGVYMTATAYHVAGKWMFDLINSTGGPKDERNLREMIDPDIALNKALNVARNNHGSGTAYVEDVPLDYGANSASFNIWAPTDDGYKTVYSVFVTLVPGDAAFLASGSQVKHASDSATAAARCPTCPECEVCDPPLRYDAVGALSFWFLDNKRRDGSGVYITATAHHVGGAWVFDLINSTGGPKDEVELRKVIDPDITLNRALSVSRSNHGSGTAYIEQAPLDYGQKSASCNVWGPTDDGNKTVYSVFVLLVP